jgi:hypothetical protein
MFIAFLITSVLFGMFISYIWSSEGFANVFCKMVFSFYTIWAILLLCGALWPTVNNGSVRLF